MIFFVKLVLLLISLALISHILLLFFFKSRWSLVDILYLSTLLFLVLPLLFKDFSEHREMIVYDKVIIEQKDLIISVLIILTGLTAAYASKFPIAKRYTGQIKKYQESASVKPRIISKVLGLVTISYLIIAHLTGSSGYSADNLESSFLLQFVVVLFPIIFIRVTLEYFYDKGVLNLIFLVLLSALALIDGFLSGMKESVIVVLIYLLIPMLLLGERIKKSLLILAAICVFVTVPFVNHYRQARNAGLTPSVSFLISFGNVTSGQAIDNNPYVALSKRASAAEALLYAVSICDEWSEYNSLNRYLYLPISWIVPSSILPMKPSNANGQKLYSMLRGKSDKSGTSITATSFGWAYLEGGLFYVFVLFYSFTAILRRLESYLIKGNWKSITLFTLLIVQTIKIESDIYFRAVSIFQILFFLWLLDLMFKLKIRG